MCKSLAWPPSLAVLPFTPRLASANSLACACLTSKSLGAGLLVQQLAQKDQMGISWARGSLPWFFFSLVVEPYPLWGS